MGMSFLPSLPTVKFTLDMILSGSKPIAMYGLCFRRSTLSVYLRFDLDDQRKSAFSSSTPLKATGSGASVVSASSIWFGTPFVTSGTSTGSPFLGGGEPGARRNPAIAPRLNAVTSSCSSRSDAARDDVASAMAASATSSSRAICVCLLAKAVW